MAYFSSLVSAEGVAWHPWLTTWVISVIRLALTLTQCPLLEILMPSERHCSTNYKKTTMCKAKVSSQPDKECSKKFQTLTPFAVFPACIDESPCSTSFRPKSKNCNFLNFERDHSVKDQYQDSLCYTRNWNDGFSNVEFLYKMVGFVIRHIPSRDVFA